MSRVRRVGGNNGANVKKRLLLMFSGGALCATLSVALPVTVAPLFPPPNGVAVAAYRLPWTPEKYPDPSAVWVYARPGLTQESAIRGIGILDSWHVSRWRAGWPLPMLEGGDYSEIHSQRGEAASGTLHLVHLKMWWSADLKKQWRLPLAPVWGGAGIATNWAAWSGVIGLLFLPGALRRAMRKRRGQCLRCGYPKGEGSLCPECGGSPAAA